MANKYTRLIDEIFQRWDPKGETKYIYLGYCHKGDIDGDWHTEVCIDLLNEDEAENKADNQILVKIKENISNIEDLLSQIEHDDNLDKAYAIISQIPNHRKV